MLYSVCPGETILARVGNFGKERKVSSRFFLLIFYALNFVNENTQNVADALEKFNLKNSAIQKALDNLTEEAKNSFREYGKQKIYLAGQDQFEIPNKRNNGEVNQMKEQNGSIQQQLEEQKKAIIEVQEMEYKTKLRGGLTLVRPEERKAEELGIEYDEDVGVSLQSYSDLLQPAKKRPGGSDLFMGTQKGCPS
ncbi:hypothetical protein TanjilG_15148 [Lupinus angustifolius]|uniref:Homologous-pairing protein 2 winged helix domain-containing protein n=1 Tax=Lupinus angustifolius TaxID=3871 RepID=A0A1J7HIR5_LUPAN|nr:hypothetical protein TanjilG_15148 [Lupinus angustifolius]